MKRSVIFVGVGLLVAFSITALASAQTKKDLGIKTLTIASGPVSGLYYPTAAKIGELYEKAFNLKVTVDIGGSAQNVRRVDAGKDADIGIAATPEIFNAYNGIAPFNKKFTNIRLLGCWNFSHFQVLVREGSGIRAWRDFKNKRFTPGPAGAGSDILARYILEEEGITYDTIRKAGGNVEFRDFSGATEAMKDATLDAIATTMSYPVPVFDEYLLNNKGYLMPTEESLLKKISQKYPAYSQSIIPAGVYKGQNSPVPTFAYWINFIVRADLPESVVYELTKTIYDNDTAIASLMAAMKDFSKKNALKWNEIPIHPGAQKYYKEIGLLKN
jgi:TRAP transporter TAXI family solute receptor